MLEIIGIIVGIIAALVVIVKAIVKAIAKVIKRKKQKPIVPPSNKYWVGRKNELEQLTKWHKEKAVRIISLVAFGGVGKSALAQKWLEGLNTDRVFWWYFYRKPSLDAFLEAALDYCSGGQFQAEGVTSPYVRVRKLLEYITKGRFVLVLDGLEDMQKVQDRGMHFGEMENRDFADLLQLWAEGDHGSLLLITTRYSLKDLDPYEGKSYRSLPLEHLLPDDARQLMRKRGVLGKDKALDKVALDYDYHALSLKLIAGYLKEYYKGDIACVPKIPFEAIETDEKVKLILTAYGDKLDEAEKAFMAIFSTFRQQVEEDAFVPVFSRQIEDFDFKQMLGHLVNLGLISRGRPPCLPKSGRTETSAPTSVSGEAEASGNISYSTHPLICKYYYEHLKDKARIKIHQQVAQYYEKKAHSAPKTLDDLTYAIEAFQHTIWTGDYEQADRIYKQRINIQDGVGNWLMAHNLGAFELDLSLISQLFPHGDTSREPLVTSADEKAWLINAVGFRLMHLGRLAEAVPFYQRQNQLRLADNDWVNTSVGSQNLCEIQLKLGNLAEGEVVARQALDWARRAKDKEFECYSLAWWAYAAFLRGENKEAGELFEQANQLDRELFGIKWLCSFHGIHYAEFLARSGKRELAEEVTRENLNICQQYRGINDIARCYQLLAGFCLEHKDYQQAEKYLDEGLQIARNIGLQEEIAKLHLGFARLYLARNDLPAANTALKEALSICTRCGYKIIEIDARNVLAQIHHAANQPSQARSEAETALSLAKTCGYHWGQVEARKELERITG